MAIQFSILNKFPEINHIITTRQGGFSKNNFESLNLSFKVGDETDKVIKNRAVVANYLSLKPENLFFPDQCHTANTKIIDPNCIPDLSETDALITADYNKGIGVLAADCVPILFYDPQKKVIAAAHAGWKGTVKNIAANIVRILTDNFGSNPGNIIAGIGPSVSQKNYEVDESVISEVNKIIKNASRFYIQSTNSGHFLLDLQELNRQLLLENGLSEANIEVLRICTFDNLKFYSARRDGFATGRFGSAIVLRRYKINRVLRKTFNKFG